MPGRSSLLSLCRVTDPDDPPTNPRAPRPPTPLPPPRRLPSARCSTTMVSPPEQNGLRICCIGAGYVGGPTMAMMAHKCPEVTVTVSAWMKHCPSVQGSRNREEERGLSGRERRIG